MIYRYFLLLLYFGLGILSIITAFKKEKPTFTVIRKNSPRNFGKAHYFIFGVVAISLTIYAFIKSLNK
jgi:hypothetical protein